MQKVSYGILKTIKLQRSDHMGLVTRRSDQLDKLFDNFAVDPKKAPQKNKKNPDKDSKQKDKDAD